MGFRVCSWILFYFFFGEGGFLLIGLCGKEWVFDSKRKFLGFMHGRKGGCKRC